jgi:hypothetical protein
MNPLLIIELSNSHTASGLPIRKWSAYTKQKLLLAYINGKVSEKSFQTAVSAVEQFRIMVEAKEAQVVEA